MPLLCLYIEEDLKMHNNGKEYEEWKKKKDKEDEILRQCGFSEEKITLLRAYDEQAFRSEQKYKANENVTKEALFAIIAHMMALKSFLWNRCLRTWKINTSSLF